jgi:CRP-like cAMP-binding protein
LFGAADADLVAAHLEPFVWAAGDVVVVEGAPQPWLYALLDGAVDVRVGGAHVAAVAAPALLGEVGFADGGPASATVVATAPCAGRRVARTALSSLIGSDPEVAAAIVHHANVALAARLVSAEGVAAADAPRVGRRAWFRAALARVLGAA